MVKMFGIPNCDTIKKAKKWLEANNVEYIFHDYKKHGVDADILASSINATSIDTVVNKRGTTYRKLSDHEKQQVSKEESSVSQVIELLTQYPSMIKRPILMKQVSKQKQSIIVGFSADNYQAFFYGS